MLDEPQPTGWHAIGTDWAKEKDKPWPEIAAMFNDVNDERAHKFVMTGRARTQLLVQYITAVERGVYRLPANTPAFAAHKGTTVEEAPAAAGEGVNRSAYVSRSHRDLTYGPTEQVVSVTGDVRVVHVDDNPHVIC